MERELKRLYTIVFHKQPSQEALHKVASMSSVIEVQNYFWDKVCGYEINDIYKKLLYRDADQNGLQHYKQMLKTKTLDVKAIETSIEGSQERKNLIRERSTKCSWLNNAKPVSSLAHLVENNVCSNLRIKFCGPVGRTGYSIAAKAYFHALFVNGADLSYKITFCHNAIESATVKDVVLCSHIDRPIDPHIVVVMCVPTQWKNIVEEQRSMHQNAKIVGLSLWESDRVHQDFSKGMDMVDVMITCAEWNKQVFGRQTNVPVYTIHCPIDLPPYSNDGVYERKVDSLVNDGEKRRFLFYTLNEWTPRKGIEDIIQAFLEEFDGNDDVALFIKSSVVPKDVGDAYIASQRIKFKRPPRIVLDCTDISDVDIAGLHKRGDCYVALTRAEGLGLGACEAAMSDKPVIMTGYGGQLDYLKGIFYVSFWEEPVNMCSKLYGDHSSCDDNGCKHNYLYVPKEQRWGVPSLMDAKATMRYVYEHYSDTKKLTEFTKQYIRKMFSVTKIGNDLSVLFRKIINS